VVGARLDIARFGFEAFRASPRQADLLILSGRVSIKMAPVVRRIYDQMLDPKYAIAMGACSSSMGVFNNYAIVPADKFMPVDVHVPGCPPRPEALMHGILKLRSMIHQDPALGWRERYGAQRTVELLPEDVERFLPVGSHHHPVALAGKTQRERLEDVRIVVDDEHETLAGTVRSHSRAPNKMQPH
jgi:NADH-quinone oxidoreductase subunit B